MSHNERVYSEEQVRRMIARATERQRQAQVATDPGSGLTMAEIERIAAEAGIDPRFIHAAAADLTGPEVTASEPTLWGVPATVAIEQRLPGPLTAETTAEMVRRIRSTFHGRPGTLETVGQSFEWRSSATQTADVHITTRREGGDTALRVEQHSHNWAVAAHMPSAALGAMSLLLLLLARQPMASFVFFLVAALLLVVARFALGRAVEKRTRKLEKLASDLAVVPLELSAAVPDEVTPLHEEPAAGRISLLDLEDDTNLTPEATRRRTRT